METVDLETLTPLDWTGWETPFLFFTGKGGVGKTTIASTVAVSLADAGRRVLLVSTDPASNLGDVFGMAIEDGLTAVPGVPTLSLLNIDPHLAAASYRERVVGPYRAMLSEADIRALQEQLSGACTVEIASFDEFTRLVADPAVNAPFDHVVFDTAPTGHTLRLLSLPSAWSGYLDSGSHGASCLGPLAGLEAQRARYRATVEALADAARTTLVLVSRPEPGALREAARAGEELAALDIRNQQLIVNGVLADPAGTDAVAGEIARLQQDALRTIPAPLAALPRSVVPLVAGDLTGLAALRALAASDLQPPAPADPAPTTLLARLGGLDALVDALEAEGPGVIMTMGKGGVGKTTIAAALAVALAERGHRVHLSTTDPAAHLTDALGHARPEHLTVTRIDPAVEVRAYTEDVIRAAGPQSPEERALLEEDLRSPCTEEIAVFRAFSRTLALARRGFVVLDTAPTGHTLLLLDTTGAYHREIMRKASGAPGRLTTPLMRLQDGAFARMLIVTLPESTPVLEAERLQADLRRAGIEPFGWVVNQVLGISGTRHPVLAGRAAQEAVHVERVIHELARRTWLVPWRPDGGAGRDGLRALVGRETAPASSVPHGV